MRMFIPESMSYAQDIGGAGISDEGNAPKSKSDAFKVLNHEVQLRKSENYIN